MNLLSVINSWAELIPNRKAFIHQNDSISYQELRDKSNSLALWINTNFPDDSSPIVVYGHKQANMLVCFLGCVKAGHPYIPIDESIPFERINRIIKNSQTALVLSPTIVPPELYSDNIVILEENATNDTTLSKIISSMGYLDPKYEVSANDNYYIIYTSGSTGEPKGVQITLGCLTSFINWAKEEFKIQNEQTFLNQAPFSFDLSVMDVYLSLATGGTIWSIDKDMIQNPKALFESLANSGINIWVSTPSFIEMCLIDKNFSNNLLPAINSFLFCGEVLSNECAQKLLERFPSVKIFNTYGPTEATVAVTSILIDQEKINSYLPLPVGYCKPDCTIKIVDDSMKVMPESEKGEIVIVGDSVSPGYFQRPDLTSVAFYTDYIDGKPKRAYKTGDLGYLNQGLLFYCGRKDFQIKLHGYRIEIEDIEQNLRKVSLVNNAVVLPIIKQGKCEYLTAFIVLAVPRVAPDFEYVMAIKKELGKLVPEYMIPRKIVFKDSLPMNQNGKVNRKLLAEDF